MDLKGKTAVVTGGTKGIGRAIAESLISAGADVAVTARHSDDIDRAVAILNSLDRGRAIGIECDVRNYQEVKSLVQRVVKDLQGIDILVNNAGIGIFRSVEDTSPEDFRAVIDTNLVGVYYCCHEVIPLMKQRGGGYIFNISSLAGVNAHAGMAAYNASKFGLNGFSEALMQEVRLDGIKVSYIMPGSVNTDFGGDSASDENSWQLQPEDIARVVMDLLGYPDRALPSRVEIRPTKPPKKS